MKLLNKAIKKGFTLVELVIVIAVIAVLAAVLIPVFGNIIKDAKISKTKADLNTCSNTLIMYAQYNEIDYYTPQNVKEFLLAEGIDINEPIMDGYSIWYNQRNFNLMLIKNDELADYVNGSSASAYHNGAVVAYADEVGASSALDNLPRRLEAVTPNEDLLLMATDKANFGLISLIDNLYKFGDSGDLSNMYNKLNNTLQDMSNYSLLNTSANSFTNYYDSFTDGTEARNFSVAWLNNAGDWIVCAQGVSNTYTIKKTIISPDIGEAVSEGADFDSASSVWGNIKVDGNTITGAKLRILCTTEIAAAKYEIKFENTFYENIVESGANIVVSGKIELSAGTSSHMGATSVSRVSTATGIASQISVAVNNGTGQVTVNNGGSRFISQTMSAEQFSEWVSENYTYTDKSGNTVTTSLINVNNATVASAGDSTTPATYKVAVTQPNGKVEYETVDNTYFDTPSYVTVEGKQVLIPYKYNMPKLELNVNALMRKEGVESADKVSQLNVAQDTFNGVTTTTIYIRYTNKDNIVVGKNYYLGVGYISSFDHYYSYYNSEVEPDYSREFKENYKIGYNSIDEVQEASPGDIGIKLPTEALYLQPYKNNDFIIEVYYNDQTRYYYEEISPLGGKMEKLLTSVTATDSKCLVLTSDGRTVSGKSSSAWSTIQGVKNVFYYRFMAAEPIETDEDLSTATSYVNTIQIDRIIIKDKDGNILIAKYPD